MVPVLAFVISLGVVALLCLQIFWVDSLRVVRSNNEAVGLMEEVLEERVRLAKNSGGVEGPEGESKWESFFFGFYDKVKSFFVEDSQTKDSGSAPGEGVQGGARAGGPEVGGGRGASQGSPQEGRPGGIQKLSGEGGSPEGEESLRMLMSQSEVDRAYQRLLEAMEKKNFDSRLYLNLGLSFELNEKLDQAFLSYEKAKKYSKGGSDG